MHVLFECAGLLHRLSIVDLSLQQLLLRLAAACSHQHLKQTPVTPQSYKRGCPQSDSSVASFSNLDACLPTPATAAAIDGALHETLALQLQT